MASSNDTGGNDTTKESMTHERTFYWLKELLELGEGQKSKYSVEDFLDFGVSGKLPLCFVLAGRTVIYGERNSYGSPAEESSEEKLSLLVELSEEAMWKILAYGKASIEYLYDTPTEFARIDPSDKQPFPVVDRENIIVRSKDWELFKKHLPPEPQAKLKPSVENPKVIGTLAYLYASCKGKSNSLYFKANGEVNMNTVTKDIVDSLADAQGNKFPGAAPSTVRAAVSAGLERVWPTLNAKYHKSQNK